MICNCPNTEPLATIPTEACDFNLEQIQKMGVQKRGNAFDAEAAVPTDITLKADWDTMIAAEDDTKIVITPFVRNLIIEPGEFITTGGGDNSTLNGVQEMEGKNPSLVTGQFKSLTPAQEKALKQLECSDVDIFFFNGEGRIIAQATGTKKSGFKAEAFGIKDRRNAGFGTKDTFDFQFSLKPGWSEDLVKEVPTDFNPLYDL
ncbi:MAG TPA: hypothetical protein VFM82_12180 [Flavobacteriaceae bacterium]|nr:hypothetical protein [Flavobacteriaceae bacterium]